MSIGSTLPSTLHAASTHARSIAPQAQHVRTDKTSKHSTCALERPRPHSNTTHSYSLRPVSVPGCPG
eukprot:1237020-Prymnesium_polylepis.1